VTAAVQGKQEDNMKTQKRFPKVLALITLLALVAIWVPARSSEQPTEASKAPRLVTGLVGLAEGQTARMSVVNWGDQPVKVELVLLDADGKADIVCNGIVAPGKSLSDDFSWPCCGGGPVKVRSELRLVDPQERKPFDQLVATLEIFDDQTGKTTALLPYVSAPPGP
jgi:hypothetical protein